MVLVAGGFNGSHFLLNTSELYDPVSESWHATGAMNVPRTAATTVVLANGRVLMAGGFGNLPLPNAEIYDPLGGNWTPTISMHIGRWAAAACLLPNGKVLVAGGTIDTSLVGIRDAELFDPAVGNWVITGSMTNERSAFTLTLLANGKVLAAGGFGTNGATVTAELYNPATGIWASAEVFDPATGIWTPTGSMGQPRRGHATTPLPSGKVLVAGGSTCFDSVFPTSTELYDPVTGTWTPTLPLVSGRSGSLRCTSAQWQFTELTLNSPQRIYRVRSP